MTKEPEQVLIQDRVTATGRIKEIRTKVTVGQKHGDRATKYRHRQQQQECRHQHCPSKKRHLMQGHARRTHVKDGGNEVHRTKDRAGTGKVKGKDRHIHRGIRMAKHT